MEITRADRKFNITGGQYDWFWKQFADQSWEPNTFKIFDQFLKPERNFLDIGAWIGPTALYAASKAKKVFAFEPDKVAFEELCRNVNRGNPEKNIIPYRLAVSDEWKKMRLGTKNDAGDSMTSVLWNKNQMDVAAVAFDGLVLDIMPNFIKIDIEGGEKDIFNDARLVLEECQPTIHLSLHTPWFTGNELAKYKSAIRSGLVSYPYIYDENLQPASLIELIDRNEFNSLVASYDKI